MIIVFAGCAPAATRAATIVDFEDLALSAQSAAPGDMSLAGFQSRGVEFNRTWATEYDCCPGAWAYSNRTDLTTSGYTNPYSAYTLPDGGGVGGSPNFAVASNFQRGEARVNFPFPVQVQGLYLANTTYVYHAIVAGNDGAGFVKGPFENGDWFRIEVVGIDDQQQDVGVVEYYLADYRNGKQWVAADWTWLDLTSLGPHVKLLEFQLSSTDSGLFGMNTPSFFAIDDLTFRVVPEPTDGLVLGILAMIAGMRRRNRR